MKRRTLKKISILAAPIVWRRLRGGRHRHRWHRRWFGGLHRRGRSRRGLWL